MLLWQPSTRATSRSMELSFLRAGSLVADEVVRCSCVGTHFVDTTSRYLQSSFCSLHDWHGVSPSHFCFRFLHSSHAWTESQSEAGSTASSARGVLTVAVRFAFCLGTTWLGVMGTAGIFVGPNDSGGVAGAVETLQDDEELLRLPKESPG